MTYMARARALTSACTVLWFAGCGQTSNNGGPGGTGDAQTGGFGGTGAGGSGSAGLAGAQAGGFAGAGATGGAGGGLGGFAGVAGAGATDAGMDASTDATTEAGKCAIGSVSSSATSNSPSVFAAPVYFNSGADLPAGTYVVTYEDGCLKYAASQGWTVNAYSEAGCCQWWMIGDSPADMKFELPGTVGYAVGGGAYSTFNACVTASLQSTPVMFQHSGGKLGIWLKDDYYGDNIPGVSSNPKWKLERVGPCSP